MSWSEEYKSATVLIADDDESQLELLEQVLTIYRFTVIAAKNGLEAVAAFRLHQPDVVLLDVDMPMMDGFRACEIMRAEFPDLSVPIVMVTGMDDVESIEKAYSVGADDFIAKPLSWPVLGHRVFYYLKGSRALNEIKTRNEREKTLFKAIPDSVIHFDEAFTPKDIHLGKQKHLFADMTCDNTELDSLDSQLFVDCQLIRKVTVLLQQHFNQSGSGGSGEGSGKGSGKGQQPSAKWQVEECLILAEQRYTIEIRIAASLNSEMIVVVRDISERKMNEARIMNLVLYDQLTGLPNRRYFEDELERYLSSNQPDNSKAAVLFTAIDRFNKINENYGLKLADQLLVETAQRLKEGLQYIFKGEHGTSGHYRLSRFNENEFAVMLTRLVDVNDAYRVAQLLQDVILDPFYLDGEEIHIALAVGIALYPDDSNDSVKLIEMAGQAANLAKRSGNQITCYSADLNDQAQRKLLIEKHLRKALENNELFLVFQPKLCVASPTMLSAEVLVRWQSPELGFVSPGEFIPIAEQNDVILTMSRWIAQEACRLNARLKNEFGMDVKLAINLSPHQFSRQESLVDFFVTTVADAGMPASYFELEITENVLIDDIDYTSSQLDQLRAHGFSIAIDDFGTGYSSLSYLTRFSINTLKIDQSFINTFADPRSQKLIETLIVMGKKLNMQIVAEGVETLEQLAFLQENQCDYVQGFIYAKPLPFEAFVAFVQSQQ